MAIESERVPALTKDEHLEAAHAKRIVLRALDPVSGDWVNVSATDNQDGSFSLNTTATITGDVTVEGASSFADSGGVDRKALVDADRHAQVDVLSSALPSGAATSANQSTIIGHLDGVEGLLTTIDADTGAMATDLAAIETLLTTIEANQLPDSHNVTVDNASIAVTGTFWQATQPVSATNLDIRDIDAASDDISVHGDVGILDQLDLTNSNPAAVAIVDGDGTQITSFGGGTQYTEDATDASITGTVAMMEVAGDAIEPIQGTVAGGLLVNLGSNNDVTVTGTVDLGATDNAVLDAIAASVAAIDTDATTIIGHVDGIEALLTTIDADTSNLSVVGGGTEAAAIRVTIANNSTGVLSVDDNGSTLSIDDGGGAITVDGTVAVTNAGLTELAAAINSDKVDVNIASSAVATGGTSAADDADFTAGTTTGTPAMGVYESTPTTVTDGDLGIVGITTGRRLKTSATIDAALPAGTNNIGDVDVLSSALPTGASTSAKQDTIIGHVDGIEALLTTIDADTSDIHTNSDAMVTDLAAIEVLLGTIDADTSTLAGAVSGSEMQVDIVSAPTLTVNAHAVTNAGTFAVQVDGSALTALQLIDDAVYVDDADWTDNTSKHLLVGGVYQGTPHTVTDGDVTPFLTDANGRLVVAATDNGSTLSIDDGGGAITVDGTVTANLSATDNAVLDAIQAALEGTLTVTGGGGGTEYTSDEASPTDPIGATSLIVRDDALSTQETTDGDWTAMRGNSRGALWVVHDGNITADLGATDNAVLDAIAASVAAIDTDATTIIGHVDGIETLIGTTNTTLGTIDTDTGNISTKIDTLAGAVSGTEMQVDVLTMPTTTVQATNLDIRDLTATDVVTANLSATDNAVLDSIDEAVSSQQITGVGHGVTTVTTAGTDVALAGSTACKRITIQAQTDNTSAIAVGASGVDATIATGTGILLYPGDVFELDTDNLADVFIDSLVNGEGVRYTYFT